MVDHEIDYPTLDIVLGLHDDIMERTDFSSAPLRDRGLLESAIMRPQQAAYYEGVDLVTQAAYFMVGIAQAQAFADGNKRTAMAVALSFLDVNSHTFTGDPDLLAVMLEEIADAPSQEQAISAIAEWIRQYAALLNEEDEPQAMPAEKDDAGGAEVK